MAIANDEKIKDNTDALQVRRTARQLRWDRQATDVNKNLRKNGLAVFTVLVDM